MLEGEKRSSENFQTTFFHPFKRLATSSAVGTAAAFAAVVLKLQLGHDGGVGIMFALLCNVVFIIGHACHEVGGKFGGFPPSGEFTLHFVPPVVCRRGTPPEFL